MKKGFLIIVLLLAVFIIWKVFTHRALKERECGDRNGDCRVYYLLNLDGMKGLGHSALLLVDKEGFGKLYSFNGMQYSLFWCLMGKEGIGRMTEYTMNPLDTELFLQTGSPEAENCEECDDFDRLLYRYVTEEQYDRIVEAANIYRETGEEYERLYAMLHDGDGAENTAREQMEKFLAEDNPRYQIYTHNCDTVARELLALADEEIRQYNASACVLTPAGNYRSMCGQLSGTWGIMRLGEDSPAELLLAY